MEMGPRRQVFQNNRRSAAAMSAAAFVVSASSRVGTALAFSAGRSSPSSTLGRTMMARTTSHHHSHHTAFATTRLSSTATPNETAAPTEVNGRISRASLPSSLDARLLSDNLDLVLSHLRSRRASDEAQLSATKIAELNGERVALIQTRDEALQQRNENSALVGKLMRDSKGEETEEIAAVKVAAGAAGDRAGETEAELATVEETMNGLLASLPNLLDDVVPDGADDSMNEIVSTWGDAKTLPERLGWTEDFVPLWHDDVATNLDGWYAEAAVGMSGARFVSLAGDVAQLERAISSYFLDRASDKGYIEVSPPLVVSRSALEGTSQLPKFEDDLFKIVPESHTCNGEDAFLIPTAEVPLTNMHANSILDEADLPLSYCALTPCFRAEAGSYGRDTRGLIRTHQFYKVELVKITTPETSDAQHEELTRHAEECLQELEIPYRKARLCSGDVGFSAKHCYDLEAWLPSTSEYREISSCSNTGDFQARRLAMRYRPAAAAATEQEPGKKKKKVKKPKPVLCHTINGSGMAVGRTLVAVLENYQTMDGDVVVPEVLKPYMRGKEILKKKEKKN